MRMDTDRRLSFRRADKADLPAVKAFLIANERPIQGVADHLAHFWLAVSRGQIVGSAGLEMYGEVGLLRSVAVRAERRNQGIGRALIERIEHDARRQNITELYLLTGAARRYFEDLGFAILPKADVPPALLASAEFQGACPASDVLMRLHLMAD